MKILKTPQVVFDTKEIEALQTIARIDCSGIDCHRDGCPFDWMPQGETPRCIKGEIKEMLMKIDISF